MARVKIISVPPLVNTSTNVSRSTPSTGIYGKKVGGSAPSSIAVKRRGPRVRRGRGTI
jgi:hypothetical protein